MGSHLQTGQIMDSGARRPTAVVPPRATLPDGRGMVNGAKTASVLDDVTEISTRDQRRDPVTEGGWRFPITP